MINSAQGTVAGFRRDLRGKKRYFWNYHHKSLTVRKVH